MNKDNIQELLKPRVKCIAADTSGDFEVGEIFYAEQDGHFYMYGDNGTWILHPDKYPHLFRRLEWWEDRDVKDMPQYLKSNLDDKGWAGNFVVEKVNEFHGDNNEYVAIDRDETLQYCTSWYLPATEAEYLNQPKQP